MLEVGSLKKQYMKEKAFVINPFIVIDFCNQRLITL
jgi:hypothetical protein